MNAVPSKAQVDAGATWTRRDALTVPGTGNSWVVAGTGDLDRDGICDIVWFEKAPANPTSAKAAGVWFVKPAVQGNLIRETAVLTSFGVNSYQGQYGASALIADFNSDDIPDILWQGDVGSGTSGIMWYMNHDRSIRDIRWIVTDPVAPNENNPVARSGPWYAGHASGVWQVARQDLSYANMNTGPASIFPVVGQVCQLGVERILGDTWYACVLPN
jgi:hypothetical protein